MLRYLSITQVYRIRQQESPLHSKTTRGSTNQLQLTIGLFSFNTVEELTSQLGGYSDSSRN